MTVNQMAILENLRAYFRAYTPEDQAYMDRMVKQYAKEEVENATKS